MVIAKWKRLFYLCFLMGSLHVLAQEKPKAVIWTKAAPESARKLFPDSRIRILSDKTEGERDKKSGYFQPDERDAIFRKVGIEDKLLNMDDLDKDMLIMGAKALPKADLLAEYPSLPPTLLEKLKVEASK